MRDRLNCYFRFIFLRFNYDSNKIQTIVSIGWTGMTKLIIEKPGDCCKGCLKYATFNPSVYCRIYLCTAYGNARYVYFTSALQNILLNKHIPWELILQNLGSILIQLENKYLQFCMNIKMK